jgi:hypothetical protein
MKIHRFAVLIFAFLNVLSATAGAGGQSAAQLAAPVPAEGQDCCAVVELRQYITYPGKRDDLIALFEREFIE